MKRFLSVFCTGIILASAAFVGCGVEKEYSRMSREYYFVMNTDAQLYVFDYFTVNGVNDNAKIDVFNAFADEVESVLRGLDAALSTAYNDSDISRFNQASAGERIEIGEDAYNVLSISKSAYELTDGYYNPAVYYSVEAYGFNYGNEPPESAEGLPDDEKIAKYVELSEHFSELTLEQSDGIYYATKPNFTVVADDEELSLKVDIGGVGKGYAVDKVNALFDKYGFEYGGFNFGSSSIAVKKFPDDDLSSTLGLANPRRRVENNSYIDPPQYLSTAVADTCISSSADNQNYYILETDGGLKRFSHIFNPFSGKPVDTGVMSATVIGGTAAENDALTTAIMAMGADSAVKFISESLSDRRVVFSADCGADGYGFYTNMAEDGYVIVADYFTPLAF